jgi:hypothetical protein
MASIDNWLARQLPDMQKSMTPLSGVDVLHISNDQSLKKMRPRIGFRQMKVEDRTIPRICAASTLLGCIYGHTGVHYMAMDRFVDDGKSTWNGVFAVYRIPVEAVIKPSKKLVPDAPQTGEVWVVPYEPSLYEINPIRIGAMFLHDVLERATNGQKIINNTIFLKVDQPYALEKDKLSPGFYAFDLPGDLTAYGGNPMEKVVNLRTISASEWKDALSKLRAEAMKRD